ncbi:MAG: ATP-dependent DNA helicase [Deltaproteobacteria bacterium]|nr:ATP-dependent DNA helicase [Deltaproteobacteria bacterium]
MTRSILVVLGSAILGKKDLALRLGKSKPNRYLNNLVSKMVHEGLIEYTIPDKPNSRLQKYRITRKGRKRMSSAQKQGTRE